MSRNKINQTDSVNKDKLYLIPEGGLGNRLYAICSAIVYSQLSHRELIIIWFKDHGCNCSFDELFSVSPELTNVIIKNPSLKDYVLYDNPRRHNLWISLPFQKLLFDRCIYYYKDKVTLPPPLFFEKMEGHKILFVSCWKYWENEEMWKNIHINPAIDEKVNYVMSKLPQNTIGVHVRLTDNWDTTKNSPVELFIERMKKEIGDDPTISFYLATDEPTVKTKMKELFGNRIYTSTEVVQRDTKDGIINAFVEINILSRTKKILAGNSSFAGLASKLTGTPLNLLCLNN